MSNKRASLRNWIVTCLKLHLSNGDTILDANGHSGTPGTKFIEWGNGDCQIADANVHQPPGDENQDDKNVYGGKLSQ